MGFYRRIDVRMHGDARFLNLSKPNPNGQTLGQYISAQEPTLNLADFTEISTKSGLKGLAAANQQMYFVDLGASKKIVKATYMTGSATRLSFLTTLRMMINSLRLP